MPSLVKIFRYLLVKSNTARSVLAIVQLDVCEVQWAQCCQGNVGRKGEVGERMGRSWDCRALVGVSAPDDLSHSQESLETLSAVAAHLCLLFLMAGRVKGRERGGGGGADSLWVLGFSPPSEIPCYSSVHIHIHRSDSVGDYSLCYGIWEAPLQLLRPVQTVTPALPSSVLLASFSPPSLPALLTCLSQPHWMNGLPFFTNLSALLTIVLWELFSITTIGCALICFVWPSTLLSLPITRLAFPHPCSNSSWTWLIAPSNNHVMFPGPVCV